VLAKNEGVPGGTSRLFASVQDPKPSCRSPRESRNLGETKAESKSQKKGKGQSERHKKIDNQNKNNPGLSMHHGISADEFCKKTDRYGDTGQGEKHQPVENCHILSESTRQDGCTKNSGSHRAANNKDRRKILTSRTWNQIIDNNTKDKKIAAGTPRATKA